MIKNHIKLKIFSGFIFFTILFFQVEKVELDFPLCNQYGFPYQRICNVSVNKISSFVLKKDLDFVKKTTNLGFLTNLEKSLKQAEKDVFFSVLSSSKLSFKQNLKLYEIGLKRKVLSDRIDELTNEKSNFGYRVTTPFGPFASTSKAAMDLIPWGKESSTRQETRNKVEPIKVSATVFPEEPSNRQLKEFKSKKRSFADLVRLGDKNPSEAPLPSFSSEEIETIITGAYTQVKPPTQIPWELSTKGKPLEFFTRIAVFLPREEIREYLTDPLAFLAEVERDRKDNIQDLNWGLLESKKLVFTYRTSWAVVSRNYEIELILVLSRQKNSADLSDDITKLIKEGVKNYEVTNIEQFLDLKFEPGTLRKLISGRYSSSTYKNLSFLGVANNGENQGFYTPERFTEIPNLSKRWLALAVKTKLDAY